MIILRMRTSTFVSLISKEDSSNVALKGSSSGNMAARKTGRGSSLVSKTDRVMHGHRLKIELVRDKSVSNKSMVMTVYLHVAFF